MMVLKLRYSLVIILLSICTYSEAVPDSVKIYVNDSTAFWHPIEWIQFDTINGKCIAVFEKNKNVNAIVRSFKNGKADGSWKRFYPNGQLLEKITYREGLKNGEYVLMDFLGGLKIKGNYKNDVKNGMWDDRILRISGRYKEGKKHGMWKWTYDGFNSHLYQFENGILKGTYSVPPPGFMLKN